MLLAQTVGPFEIVAVVAYLSVVAYLGYLGYRQTSNATDYLIAGRKAHPFVMAMSYGATFISTSAIVGFGGVAGLFGMSLLWLTFCNIFVGIFISFVFLGGPTRRMGHRLDAHTFPELLARRYQSKFIQVFAGILIFLLIPLYAAAVLIGGTEFISGAFKIDYQVALLAFSVMVAVYVVVGGLKGVMYTDALQGTIMFVGMAVLLVWSYAQFGGVVSAHNELTSMKDQVFVGFKGMGHQGWTSMPAFGWGDAKYDLWWIVVSTITLGVGIGVLAQPQLVVRFMTVRSKRELNRAVAIGGVFILVMTGVAFTVGSLSNAYFYLHDEVTGVIINRTENVGVIAKKERGVEKRIPCNLIHIDTDNNGEADVHLVEGGAVPPVEKIMPKAEIIENGDGTVTVKPRATSFTRAIVRSGEDWIFNPDSIIPTYVSNAMPRWFGVLFLLSLLAAAMSTLSSQFHAAGTSIGRDVFEQLAGPGKPGSQRSMHVVRIGMILGILMAVLFSYYARGGYIIARATAIFFGLCAAAFLPAFVGGLFFRGMTRPAAIASMLVGTLVSGFWVVFVKAKEANAIGLVLKVTGGKQSLLADAPNWPVVDPIVVALPASIIVAIAVSLLTKPPGRDHLDVCFGGDKR